MEEKQVFTINAYSPHATIQGLEQIYEGTVENGLVTFDNDFAQGKLKYVDYDNKMVAIISNIQYKKKTQFNFSYQKTGDEWISLLFNSQNCILMFNDIQHQYASHNNHGSFIEIKNGNVVWQPAFDIEKPIETIAVFISAKWFDKIVEASNREIKLKKMVEEDGEIFFINIEKKTLNISEQIFQMVNSTENNPFLNIKLESYMWALVSDTLYRYFKLQKGIPKQITQNQSEYIKAKMMAVKDEILNDFSKESLDLDYLTKLTGMNRTTFQQTFKAIFNAPFYQFYQEARFNEALRLLEFESYSTTAAASAIGYKNVSYFIKEFQKRFGMTPNEYKLKKK